MTTDPVWTTEAHGKAVAAVYFPNGEEVHAEANGLSLHLSATYHGDRDEFWIVASRDGREVARHNPRHIESIVWVES